MAMIKLSDYVANKLYQLGIRHVFMVTGGGAMHLNDSFGKHPGLKYVCNHHEQACAMAAESYARLSGRMAAINVTTGPGGINALNGVFGAFTDSIPMLVISGQVRYDTTVQSTGLDLRQLGDQEFPKIIDVAGTMTKYAVMVTDPGEIRHHLEKAFYLGTTGRKGPVWIDIPMDIQGAFIEEETLKGFDRDELTDHLPPPIPDATIEMVMNKIIGAQRPILLVGSGVRLAGGQEELLRFIEKTSLPVATAWNAHDLIEDSNPFYVGRPGTIGDRAGNFAVQNSDLLLVIGSRLNIRQIGYNYKSFARRAFKILVDIDPIELKKPTVIPDLSIWADAKDFMKRMNTAIGSPLPEKAEWIEWCTIRRQKYPVVSPEYWKKEQPVNPYCFMRRLFEALPEEQIVVSADGTACVTSFQAAVIKRGQRLYTNSGSASMGYEIPAAVGACFGSGGAEGGLPCR